MAHPSTSFSSDGESFSLPKTHGVKRLREARDGDCKSKRHKVSQKSSPEISVASVKRSWEQNVQRINRKDPTFFTSKDARLMRDSTTWKEEKVYDGVKATKDNCFALDAIYKVFFRFKERNGFEDKEGFSRISNTVSQFLRLCVAFGLCEKHHAYKENVLFDCVANLEVVECFINFNVNCCSRSTSNRKARHLRKVCMIAPGFMTDYGRTKDIARVSQYLDVIIRAKKNCAEYRCQSRQLIPIHGAQFIRECFQSSIEKLNDMVERFYSAREERTINQPVKFVSNWTPAFITFLVVCSAGQSPLAIAQIEVQSQEMFQRALDRASTTGYVQLPTLGGKRTQVLGHPMAAFPAFSVKFLRFHITVIHPMITAISGRNRSTGSFRTLLVHSWTGERMKSSKIAYEFRTFTSQTCTSASAISLRDVRSIVMNCFLSGFRAKLVMAEQSEAKFLDAVARHINTTALQVKKCVGVLGSAEYKSTAKELIRLLGAWRTA